MDEKDIIIIVISETAKNPPSEELILINKCEITVKEAWKYVLSNGKYYNVIIDNIYWKSHKTMECSFILINPLFWEDNEVNELLVSLNEDKVKLVWTHITDGITEENIKKKIKNVYYCESFSHGNSVIEDFMINISKNSNYQEEIKKLIKYSLEKKKPIEELLKLLQSLNIDLQALSYLNSLQRGERKKTKQKMDKDIIEKIINYFIKNPTDNSSIGMLREEIDYKEKFYEGLKILNPMPNLKNIRKQYIQFINIFLFLNNMKEKVFSNLNDNDNDKDIVKESLNDQFWENINLFNNWYYSLE